VPLGFLCAALFIFLAQPRPVSLAIGGAVSVLGLALRAWASGHIRKNDALATSGPYAYTRNPLYLGSFLLGLGFTIGSGWWPLGIAFAALFLGIYFPVMRVESTTLAEIFGTDYQRYASEVPLFVPRFRRFRNPADRSKKFDSRLYLRYREYRAALGLLVAWGILAFKAYYLK
jgi:protein-S-isoprenylcysteine O-methyltransferase Ste14